MIRALKERLFFAIWLVIMAHCAFAAHISEDFSDTLSKKWIGEREYFVAENGRLRSNCATDSKKAYIAIKSYDLIGTEWTIEGEMLFPVSSSNFLRIYLASDKQNPSDIENGYYIQIGSKDKNFTLRRVKTRNHYTIGKGETERLNGGIVKYAVRVMRDRGKGKFTLQSKINDEKEWKTECECTDNSTTTSLYFALEPHYTKTRADKFYFDKVTIKSDYKDTTKPQLLSHYIYEDMVETYWNIPIEDIRHTSEIAIKRIEKDGKKVVFYFDKVLTHETKTLTLNNIYGANGQTANQIVLLLAKAEKAESGDVVINEILYDPPTGVSEFIELKNVSTHSIDISSLFIAFGDNAKEYPLSDAGSMIVPSGGFALVSRNIASVCEYYGCGKCATSHPDGLPYIRNAGGDIVLKNEDGEDVDRVSYADVMHNAIAKETKGRSVCRISDENGKFVSSSDANKGATPGKDNIIAKKGKSGFTLKNKAITKEEAVARIEYELEEDGMQTDIFVYDKSGRRVRTLCNSKLFGGKGEIEWDGKDDNNEWLPISPYIIICEAYGAEGGRVRKRLVCTIGEHD